MSMPINADRGLGAMGSWEHSAVSWEAGMLKARLGVCPDVADTVTANQIRQDACVLGMSVYQET